MFVRECENACEFLKEYERILLEREAVSQLLLYNAYQEKDSHVSTKGSYGAVIESDLIILLYGIVSENSLLLYPVNQDKALEAVVKLTDSLVEKHISVSGIIARLDLCQGFIKQYKNYHNIAFLQKQGMDIMEIRKVNEIKPAEGLQRLAHPEDAMLVADWMLRIQMEAMQSELDYEAVLENAEKLIRDNRIYLYENTERRVVSMAAAARKLVHGITITDIYTPEEYRGNGYAAANIYYLSKALLEQGQEFCSIIVDKNNMLSIRAYEKVGYWILEDQYVFKLLEQEE
jgi:predicted GNAT family acetyltransferase